MPRASCLDVATLRASLVGRGVLADVATYKGVEALDPAYEITGADLEDCLEQQRVETEPGDFLLVRTGRLGVVRRTGAWDTFVEAAEPGVGLDGRAWLWEHEIAAVASDTWAMEVLPSREPSLAYPVHTVGIVHMGLLLGEMFDLDALAAACRADGRYAFFFVGAPLPLVGGVGSPVNPIAIR